MKSIWAIADLHLAKSVPEKDMGFFGAVWEGYMDTLEREWKKVVTQEDLVLIPGDISWAMQLREAEIDLQWIDALPGKKIILRGNHDYWWPSSKKLKEILPPSIQFIHNTAISWNGVAIGGARLWDTIEYSFGAYTEYQKNSKEKKQEIPSPEQDQKIFEREVQRLKLSLDQMDRSAGHKIAMTHYPPIGGDLASSQVSSIFEEYGITEVVFGHIHSIKKGVDLFGKKNGISYHLVAADYLGFKPKLILG